MNEISVSDSLEVTGGFFRKARERAQKQRDALAKRRRSSKSSKTARHIRVQLIRNTSASIGSNGASVSVNLNCTSCHSPSDPYVD